MGSTAWSRTYIGKTAVLTELLRPLAEQLDGPNYIVADRIVAEADIVVVEGRGANHTKSGIEYCNHYCWIIRMIDGKMSEITEYADTQLIIEALDAPHVHTQG